MHAAFHIKPWLEGVEAETELIALVIIAKDQNLILKTKGEIYFLYSKKMSKDNPRGISRAISVGVMGWRSWAVKVTHSHLPGTSPTTWPLAFTLSAPCPCSPWKATLTLTVFPALQTNAFHGCPSSDPPLIRICASTCLPDGSAGGTLALQWNMIQTESRAVLSAFPQRSLQPSVPEPR